MSRETVQVRGYTSFNHPASLPLKRLATFSDIIFIFFLVSLAIKFSEMTLTPGIGLFCFLFPISVVYWIPQKFLFGTTCGERLWQLKPKKSNDSLFRGVLYQRDILSIPRVFIGSLVATFFLLFTLSTLHEVILKHPLWTLAQRWNLAPFSPSKPVASPLAKSEWFETPFFYEFGSWPKTFEGNPIFYSVEYEKGPPLHFVGHIVADWSPNISIVIEGPRTPVGSGDRNGVKKCILNGIASLLSYRCINLKSILLSRHLSEIKSIHPKTWSIKWFNVENALIPSEDQPQGVYLSGSNETQTQDRFILINSLGAQQTVILNRPKNTLGDQAFQILQKALGSQKNFSELNYSRNWVNQEISHFQIESIQTLIKDHKDKSSEELLLKLANIQNLLISRISVLPQSLESYFHLGGISHILMQSLSQQKRSEVEGSNSRLILHALKNIESSYRYALDISPQDPKTEQLFNLWKEAKDLGHSL